MRKAGTLAALFEATHRTLSAVTGEDARGSRRARTRIALENRLTERSSAVSSCRLSHIGTSTTAHTTTIAAYNSPLPTAEP